MVVVQQEQVPTQSEEVLMPKVVEVFPLCRSDDGDCASRFPCAESLAMNFFGALSDLEPAVARCEGVEWAEAAALAVGGAVETE